VKKFWMSSSKKLMINIDHIVSVEIDKKTYSDIEGGFVFRARVRTSCDEAILLTEDDKCSLMDFIAMSEK